MIDLKEEKEVLKAPRPVDEVNSYQEPAKKVCLSCGKADNENDEAGKKFDRVKKECTLLLDDIKKSNARRDASIAEKAILRERYNASEAETAILRARNDATEAKIRSLKVSGIVSFFYSLLYYFLGVVTGFYLDSFFSLLFTVFKILYSKLVLILGF